jgi:prefoldin subunit 5
MLTLEDKLKALPTVEFVEDVDSFMNLPANANNAALTLKREEDMRTRLKMLEANNVDTKKRLQSQTEELTKTLEMLSEIKRRKIQNEEMSTHFRFADHVFLKAKVPPADKIGLWLGANVMLEFDLEEGETLLKEKSAKAAESLKMTNALIDAVRELVTTTEVNMARIYNWDVKRRQLEKEKLGIKDNP